MTVSRLERSEQRNLARYGSDVQWAATLKPEAAAQWEEINRLADKESLLDSSPVDRVKHVVHGMASIYKERNLHNLANQVEEQARELDERVAGWAEAYQDEHDVRRMYNGEHRHIDPSALVEYLTKSDATTPHAIHNRRVTVGTTGLLQMIFTTETQNQTHNQAFEWALREMQILPSDKPIRTLWNLPDPKERYLIKPRDEDLTVPTPFKDHVGKRGIIARVPDTDIIVEIKQDDPFFKIEFGTEAITETILARLQPKPVPERPQSPSRTIRI